MASEASQASPADQGHRRERVSVATQACEVCRSRKTRCDEQRPSCGLCRRLNLECVYREPLPTKKDKTMVHILESLARLELKFDRAINSSSSSASPEKDTSNTQPESSSQGSSTGRTLGYDHITPPHKVILWPTIYIFLANTGNAAAAESQNILQQGTAWFLQQERASQKRGLAVDTFANPTDHGRLLHRAEEMCHAYFDNFNVLAPILDRTQFIEEIARPSIANECRDYDTGTVLTLIVMALGHTATQGVFDEPISTVDDIPSGFRGGNAERPPGLMQFNEARKRFGFIFTQISLETVQILLLMATYYETSARHLDFWKSAVSASVTCQALIRGQKIEWTKPYGHALKRAFWACMLNEMFYHDDLDFPESGIEDFQEQVPTPSNYEDVKVAGALDSEDRTEFHRHFLAMVTLRQIISRIHETIHKTSPDKEFWVGDRNSSRFTVIREMAHQLESWRNLLPGPLQWQDHNRFSFPNIGPANRTPSEPLFTAEQTPVPVGHRYNVDIMVAQLRTRYYYARFMIYRPFIWRALHVEESMTSEDNDYCALAVKSALLWPMIMAPPKNKKRLVPHHFTWTQNFIGILLILRMRWENDCFKKICDDQVNRAEMQTSIGLMLEWIRDMRQVDGVADWGWRVLEPLYTSDL